MTAANKQYDIIYHHSPCPDGDAAAFLLKENGKLFVPYTFGKTTIDPKDVLDKHVLFVDVCPQAQVLRVIRDSAASVYVIDHHPVLNVCESVLAKWSYTVDTSGTRCAARMVWDMHHPHDVPPYWLRVVNLHDTGQFAKMTADDRAFHMAFHRLERRVRYGISAAENTRLIREGEQLIKESEARVERAVKDCYHSTLKVGDSEFKVGYAEVSTGADIAPTATKLLDTMKDAHFVAIRWPQDAICNFSLRRRATDTIDLNAIAMLLGGGGHQAASAVQRPVDTRVLS